jgi:hypothetical protein
MAKTAFADSPIINTFTASLSTANSGQPVSLTWNISNASSYTLSPTCGVGITIRKLDGGAIPCGNTITGTSGASDSLDLLIDNVYGSTQTVTFAITPIDESNTVATDLRQTRSITVLSAPYPINSFTSSATSSEYSFVPVTLSWTSIASLTAANIKIGCQENLIATSSSYESGILPLPCNTPIFATNLNSPGSVSISFWNKTTDPITIPVVLLPAPGEQIFDGIHSQTLNLTINPPLKLTPGVSSFTSSSLTPQSGKPVTLSWNTREATGLNLKISCDDAIVAGAVTGSSTSPLPCSTTAFDPALSTNGSVNLLFYSSVTTPIPISITALPKLVDNSYDATHSKILNLLVYPTSTTQVINTPQATSSKATVQSAAPKKAVTLLTKQLLRGSQNNEVKILQTYLKTDKALYPEGVVNGMFGPAAEKAVGRFQIKYELAKKGVVGYGQVGPKTRAKLNELLAQ